MKRMPLFVLLAALPLCAADITGTWKAVILGPQNQQPKTVSEMTFEFRSADTKLTGKAHVGSWPGDAEISEGKIEGNQVSFTVLGNSPWHSRGPRGREASGYPRLRFTGTVDGDQIMLHLVWDSVMAYGDGGQAQEWQVAGKKSDAH